MGFRKNKEKEKREKMVLISGTVIIILTALIGTQLTVEGRIYGEKVSYLERRGYILNDDLKWSEYEDWKQEEIMDQLRGEFRLKLVRCFTWQEWKDNLKSSENAAVYDDSLWGDISHCNETYTIWFHSINSRKLDGVGELTTFYVQPDEVPENSEG